MPPEVTHNVQDSYTWEHQVLAHSNYVLHISLQSPLLPLDQSMNSLPSPTSSQAREECEERRRMQSRIELA